MNNLGVALDAKGPEFRTEARAMQETALRGQESLRGGDAEGSAPTSATGAATAMNPLRGQHGPFQGQHTYFV
ncbi:hypothetical protein GJ744_000938 [Endocarpon pusillum]|uniref:Uncharacterized protein n=1 Tax=Endocarpon pusillum TaxID=364733 RepID=A0A8H7E0Z5_9EURO|nr:hypothetical protein GJ744_000938 [Endocarpon pusillum]